MNTKWQQQKRRQEQNEAIQNAGVSQMKGGAAEVQGERVEPARMHAFMNVQN